MVIKYISPYIIKLKEESKTLFPCFSFLLLHIIYLNMPKPYILNFYIRQSRVIIEFMDSFIVILYFFLSIVTPEDVQQKEIQQSVKTSYFPAAAAQAEKKYLSLQIIRKQAAIYRHDLRHHMNFIQSCLAVNNTQAS